MKFFIQLFVCLLLLKNCFAQSRNDSTLKTLAQRIIDNTIALDKEKTLLVTDRKIYSAGETVYFKAFLVDSIQNYLRTKPAKLYVDYVDEKDNVIAKLLLKNTNFQTSGQFVLPDSLPEGFYWMRAYSKSMIDSDFNNIAVLPLYVFGKVEKQENVLKNITKDSSNKTIIKLYPEGGAIISGLNSTIAVSIKDENGEPLIVDGIVENNHDSIVSAFTTNKYGLAKFSYFSKWFNKYKILLKHNSAYDSIAALPKTNFYAAQLAVTQQNSDYITARVALEDSIYSKNYTTYLIALSGDSLCFTGVGRGMYNVVMPTSKFPKGVATLYLFNDERELLSSRNVYINRDNYHLTIQADKQNYAARDKIKLNFKLTDENNQPEVASFSLSVADKNVLDTNLNFFETDTLQNLSPEDVDLIMLTQDQKTNPLYSNTILNHNDDNDSGFILSGTIVNAKSQPVSNCIITILSSRGIPIIETDTSAINGKFKFNLPPYTDSTQFIFQLSDMKGKNQNTYRIIFDADSAIHFSTPSFLKRIFLLNTSLQSIKSQLTISDSVSSFEGKHWLKPVTVKGYKQKEVNFDEHKRVSKNSQIITGDMIGDGPGMASVAIMNNAKARLLFEGPAAIANDPTVVLDGMEIPRRELIDMAPPGQNPIMYFINSIPVSTIDFIEVLVGPEAAAYGMEGGHGVILINTRAGGNILSGAGLGNFYAKGFYNEKPFEMPDYSNPQIQKLKMQDLRKTIYWNGNIVTDKNGEASVEFFSADEATTYIGIIRGITVNGDKIYQIFTINRN